MRVAVYYSNRDVRLEERPKPEIGTGEMLIRVEASGICGSDVMEWYRLPRAPLVLGHEVAGVVVAVGEGVERYEVGQRIAANHHVPCNTCHYCLRGSHTVCDTLRQTNFDPGGFAEYIRLPAILVDRGVYPLPEEVSFEEATFIEPLACVIRGQLLADMQPGYSVLVIGSGISGLLHVQLACALGASRVVATDTVPYRLEVARRFGAYVAINAEEDIPARLRECNDGKLANMVIVCTGAVSALTQALQSVERGGTILLFAPMEPSVTVPISMWDIWHNGIKIVTSYANTRKEAIIALKLIRHHRVNVYDMITHRLSLAETGLGLQIVAQAQDSIKVIIEPQR